MKLPNTLRYCCLTLALASGAGWAASGSTAEDTAPATPGLGVPSGSDMPGAPGKAARDMNDPAGANGALDTRHIDKKPVHKGTHDKPVQKPHGTREKKTNDPAPAHP